MEFEWDEAKNRQNIVKHGIDFSDARRVFAKPMVIRSDDRQDYGEERWAALGELNQMVVVVIFTLRHKKIRIISMRKGSKHEHQIYQNQITSQSN